MRKTWVFGVVAASTTIGQLLAIVGYRIGNAVGVSADSTVPYVVVRLIEGMAIFGLAYFGFRISAESRAKATQAAAACAPALMMLTMKVTFGLRDFITLALVRHFSAADILVVAVLLFYGVVLPCYILARRAG